MKQCCHCRAIKPFNEFYKNNSTKDGYSFDCRNCRNISAKNSYQKNKPKILEYQKKYGIENKEKLKYKSAEYYKLHRDEIIKKESTKYWNDKDKKREYDRKHREEAREKYRAASRRWAKNHPERKNADTMARRAAIAQRLPSWADLNSIRIFYENCPKGYEVDHIIPLRGKFVSGLHVLENLQYLSRIENRIKSNHFSLGEGKK